VIRMEHRCPKCASLQLTRVRESTFAIDWRCLRCTTVFVNPLVSVVLVDPVETRRAALVSCLKEEGIPVVAVTRLADVETWPVGKVLVTDLNTCPRFQTGAAHVVVLTNSDEERAEAAAITDGSAIPVKEEPAALIATLRGIAKSNAIAPSPSGATDRRSGPPERRRHTRRDRRST
jgi:CheY-like chemotaxis protein